MMYIRSISIRLPKKSQATERFLTSIFCSLLMFIGVPVFCRTNSYFWKNIKTCVPGNCCLNRWFNLVYFKVGLLVYLAPKSSEVTGFILVLVVMLKWRKTYVKKSSVYWSYRFYIPILCIVVIIFCNVKEGKPES